jgi:phosphatidylglycerophosphate synthase
LRTNPDGARCAPYRGAIVRPQHIQPLRYDRRCLELHPDTPTQAPRRPLKSRDTGWARALAALLVRLRLRPNTISLLSVLFAAAAGKALWLLPEVGPRAAVALCIVAAAGIQLRLICNLLDGMVAIEGGMKSKTGEIWNDLPDRFADAFVLLGAGYSIADDFHVPLPGGWSLGGAFGPELGWLATALAILTAYVRLLGGAAGAMQQFCGPMAKPHRMAVVTVACLLVAGERALELPPRAMPLALAIVIVGCVVTVARRTALIARELEAK